MKLRTSITRFVSGIGVAWGGPLAREHSMSINTEASRMLAGGPEAFAVSEIGRPPNR
jgi:hypothetical protein